MFDVKLSKDNVFDLPAGPVGALIGFEYREETYSDDRDPLLDGTIPFNTDSSLATNITLIDLRLWDQVRQRMFMEKRM